jgi:lysophospholipase L1-like esterase
MKSITKYHFKIGLILLLIASTWACESKVSLQEKYAGTKDYWIPEVSQLLALDTVETYTDGAILFMGSSSIRLWKTLQDDMKPYDAIRRGYGGASYSDLIHFTEAIVSPHKLSGIVIFVANDIRAQPDDKHPEEVLALFQEVVQLIRKHHPKTPVFSIAVTPTPSRWAAWNEISKANDLIEVYCKNTENLHFIKTSHGFLTAEGKPDSSLFVQDMLHQNEKGYAIWAGIIKKEIQKVISEPTN